MTSLESKIRGKVLGAYRRLKQWSAETLGERVGTSPGMIAHYEAGTKELPHDRYLEFGRAMGFTQRRLEAAFFGLNASPEEIANDPAGENDPERGSLALGRRIASEVAGQVTTTTTGQAMRQTEIGRGRKQDRWRAHRLCARLLRLPRHRQAAWVAEEPAFRSWAAVERLAELSERAASSDPQRARELAGWAKRAAARVPKAAGRQRCVGYAGFFVGNALRASGRFLEAQAAFESAWVIWRAGEARGEPPFAPWRPFDLESSLRKDQEHYPIAAELADRALSLAPLGARARILLKKASCLHLAGMPSRALPVLAKVASLLDGDRQAHLSQIAHFIFAVCLFDLERFAEAGPHLVRARGLAMARDSALDLARCDWLGGRLNAALGQREKALLGFSRAREAFAFHGVAHDCAAVALHESVLLLELGETRRARHTAAAVAWTFASEGLVLKARKAIETYCLAAQGEEATVELARWALGQLDPKLLQVRRDSRSD